MTNEFTGYISKVEPNAPVVVTCENEMFIFKQTTIKKLTLKDADLKSLLDEIVPSGITVESVDAKLGNFRITDATPSQVLEEIKKTYRLPVFFRDSVLYVGRTYWNELQQDHTIKFERNVVSNDLEFMTEDERKIKVKVVSMLRDNKKIEIDDVEYIGINDNGQYIFDEFTRPGGESRVVDASVYEIRIGLRYDF